MRVIDFAGAALALRASETRANKRQRRPVPAVDVPQKGVLNRNALPQQLTALIASMWPAARQCVVRPVYSELPAPAQFGRALRITWPAISNDARALQARLATAFPRTETQAQVRGVDAA